MRNKEHDDKLRKDYQEAGSLSPEEARKVLEDLRLHQEELEIQNEELKKAQDIIEESRERLSDLYDFAPVAYVTLDKNGVIREANLTAASLLGHDRQKLIGKPFFLFITNDNRVHFSRHQEKIKEGHKEITELELKTSDGQPLWGRVESVPFKDKDGNVLVRTIIVDITEQRSLEDQLRQSHKMEAIGTLSGGIAHDFNNILAVILGNSELILDDIDKSNSDIKAIRYNIQQIIKASKRAKDLVSQILTFSRKGQDNKPQYLNLAPLLQETVELLRSSMPVNVKVELVINTDTDVIKGNSSQIQQILMNLASNSAYTMQEKGGIFTVTLSTVTLSRKDPDLGNDMKPGRYIKLNVRDTGPGIPKHIRRRIFDPFFTTKKLGEGTGMGLATVYGLVKAHQGRITVDSTNEGTAFNIFFPARTKKVTEAQHIQSALPGGTEEILLIDDDPMIVEMTAQMLGGLGYSVTTAHSGPEALSLIERSSGKFDVVVTDYGMPDISGSELAERIRKIRENLPIILMTGYSETITAEKAKSIGISEFIMKPVTRKHLAETIRQVLDQPKGT